MRRQTSSLSPRQLATGHRGHGLHAPWPSADVPLKIEGVPGVWSLAAIQLCGEREFCLLVPFKKRHEAAVNKVVVDAYRVSRLELQR